MKTLTVTQFGNPLLRKQAKEVKLSEITSLKLKRIISDIRHTLTNQELGVALAAPQTGYSIQLVVIAIRPMPHRPNVKKFDLVLINPKIIKLSDKQTSLWEGCISSGSDGKANLFTKVPRSNQVKVEYYDESGTKQTKNFTGLKAQVVQHEVDHLNGVLFVDRVKDTKTFMTYSEYMKRIRKVGSTSSK